MTKKNKIIVLAAVVISVAALAAAAGFWAARMLDPETHRAALIQHLKTALNRDVRFARGEVSLWLRPAFTFTDVVILEKDAQTTFITADRLSFKLSLLPLLRKKIVLREVALENPRIALIWEASGAFNVSDLFDDRQQALSFGIRRLQIQNGFIHFTDRRIAPEPLTTSLERINLRLSRLERGKAADFSLNATVVAAEKKREYRPRRCHRNRKGIGTPPEKPDRCSRQGQGAQRRPVLALLQPPCAVQEAHRHNGRRRPLPRNRQRV